MPVPPVTARCSRGGGPVRPSAVMAPCWGPITSMQFASGWLEALEVQLETATLEDAFLRLVQPSRKGREEVTTP